MVTPPFSSLGRSASHGNSFSNYFNNLLRGSGYSARATSAGGLLTRSVYGADNNPQYPSARSALANSIGRDLGSFSPGRGLSATSMMNQYLMNDFYQSSGSGDSAWKMMEDKKQQATSTGSGGSGGSFGTIGSSDEGVLQWSDLINSTAQETGVPPDVLAAIIHIETGGTGNAQATGPMTSYGVKAQGLMQVMPNWFSGLANQLGDGNLYNPETNIKVGAHILKGHYDSFGSWDAAARAYFAGEGGMNDLERTDGHGNRVGTSVAEYQNLFRQHRKTYQQQMTQPAAGVDSQSSRGGGTGGSGGYVFPVEGYSGGLSLHWGSAEGTGAIDLFAPRGTPVRAITAGTANSGYSDIGGYWTMIQGDDGLQYYYAHQDRMGPNGRIEAGGYIGGVGDTGNAKGTGPHLHLGIGNTIYSGTGPKGGAGDINIINFLRNQVGYAY